MRAIVGGSGRLPDILLAQAGGETAAFAPEGVTFGEGAHRAEPFAFERLGALMMRLRGLGARAVVFAGALRRPTLAPEQFDEFTARAMEHLAPALNAGGDDAVLRAVISLFEGEGFEVVGAQDLVPALLPAAGVPTKAQPQEADRVDAARGFEILRATAAADLGQACVVAQGQALALEAAPGTDWMLATLEGHVPGRLGRGVLCKAPKPQQDRRVDLPAIGPETVSGAAWAGLAGIAVEAGGALVLDLDEVVEAADAAGLFLWVRGP